MKPKATTDLHARSSWLLQRRSRIIAVSELGLGDGLLGFGERVYV